MMLRRLQVEHFRGIRHADWAIDKRLSVLVGAGDSTKTTLLDAVGLVLSPTYNPHLTDADFFNLDLTRNIVIHAVITHLPESLIKENQFGKDRSGLTADGTLVHDPLDGVEECFIVRLTVTPNLEPLWEIIRPDTDEARPISTSQRRQLGFFRLGERPDLHLRWARGSALVDLTGGVGDASSIILGAQRVARQAVFGSPQDALEAAAQRAGLAAASLGAAFSNLRPGLEPGSASSAHSLVLHSEDIPLLNYGLGTRRLASLAIQDQAKAAGGIIAIDELEHGLEPHRLTQVLNHLKARTSSEDIQVITTTHSPVVVTSLSAADLTIVSSDDRGETTCQPVPVDLDSVQGTMRSAPEAVLGRRIMVGEGASEVGFLRGLLRYWDQGRKTGALAPAAALGVALVDGGGTSAPRRATVFRKLGYATCVILDNDDRGIDQAVREAEAVGITVARWGPGMSLEDEIFRWLPEAGVDSAISCAVQLRGQESVSAAVAAELGVASLTNTNLAQCLQSGLADGKVRQALARASKRKGKEWFKRQDLGEELADIVVAHLDALPQSTLLEALEAVRAFAYQSESAGSRAVSTLSPADD